MFDGIGGKAISLHIRRTDHLIKPTYHPVLPLSYYQEALSKFPSDLPVIVFSDEPHWVNMTEFFDNIIVNDQDITIRKNRLELLQMLCKTFENYINFSKIESI